MPSARRVGVPVHRLLGHKVRDRGFISWWAIDQPAADWILECKDAVAAGFTVSKPRHGRGSIEGPMRQVTSFLPDYMRVNFDFNGTLRDSAHAGRYCVEIGKYPHVAMYETPIPQSDVAGNKQLRSQTRVAIAMHYGSPPIMTALHEDVCDGFVIGGGASRVKADEQSQPWPTSLSSSSW